MRGRRRPLAAVLLAALLGAATVGGRGALAVGDEVEGLLRAYTEAVTVAHGVYGREVSYRDLVFASIQGMLRTLDPHTSFLSPEAYSNMRERQQESFFGVGILVSMRHGLLTVITPVEGTPASRMGLRAGDVISAVDGESTESMSLDEAVSRIKGPRGTEVSLEITRPGLDEPLEMVVTRDEIPQTTVRQAYLIEPGTGYLAITDFNRGTGREVAEAIDRLRAAGMKRLVLDLRNNGGGLLDQAIAVSDLFLPEGSEIVATRGRTPGSNQRFADDGGPPDPELAMPLVVLVNRGTASAAEILAGAIQDHDEGLVVGTRTWGKGLVQTVYNLSYGAGLAVTTSRYHTPSGRVIQRDYSSWFDYTSGGEAAVADDRERQVFLTDAGREVYGGGGITPDVTVEPAELSVLEQYLLSRNAFMDFAVEYRPHPPIDSLEWRPGPEVWEAFKERVVETGLVDAGEAGRLDEPGLRDFGLGAVHAELFNARFGFEARHRVLAAGDEQIQAALGLFDRAEALAAGPGG
ncbi:MAG: S41 family peptidase [Thermoanaerobaculia bacterium]|nr:S41 family peptidase [Thermoanaerobaculia bacterium]